MTMRTRKRRGYLAPSIATARRLIRSGRARAPCRTMSRIIQQGLHKEQDTYLLRGLDSQRGCAQLAVRGLGH